jgi:hypothetical protein
MTYDPDIQLLMANSRIAEAQAIAANQRLARRGTRSHRSERDDRGSRTSGTGGSIVSRVLAPVRRLTGIATSVASRRHPAGKAA